MSKKKRTHIDLSGEITQGKNLAVASNVHLGAAVKSAITQSSVSKPAKGEDINPSDAAIYKTMVGGGGPMSKQKGDARRRVKKYKKQKKMATLAADVKAVTK